MADCRQSVGVNGSNGLDRWKSRSYYYINTFVNNCRQHHLYQADLNLQRTHSSWCQWKPFTLAHITTLSCSNTSHEDAHLNWQEISQFNTLLHLTVICQPADLVQLSVEESESGLLRLYMNYVQEELIYHCLLHRYICLSIIDIV